MNQSDIDQLIHAATIVRGLVKSDGRKELCDLEKIIGKLLEAEGYEYDYDTSQSPNITDGWHKR